MSGPDQGIEALGEFDSPEGALGECMGEAPIAAYATAP